MSSQRPSASPGEPAVCEDLLLAILEELPSRTLVTLRGVSQSFAALVDEVLRTRFLDLALDEANEVALESHAPYETRAAHRQTLAFSHFGGGGKDVTYTGSVAHFRLAAETPTPQFLSLDDGEMFAQNIVSVRLSSAPMRHDTLASTADAVQQDDIVHFRGQMPVPVPQFCRSLSLASSLDRLFRSYFEVPSPQDAAASTPNDPFESFPAPPSSPRPATRPHRLASPYNPASPSALFGAQIECVQVDPSSPADYDSDDSLVSYDSLVPGARWGRSSPGPMPPRLFEFVFSEIELDVGKVVVAAEEGLPGGGRRKTRVGGGGGGPVVLTF
ncbi:hypothetical protein JCM10213_008762 [Rhodosporidiobolus nylandii]